jgi:hypothetical protein
MVMKLPLKTKEVDDILAEEQKWEHAQRTDGVDTSCFLNCLLVVRLAYGCQTGH